MKLAQIASGLITALLLGGCSFLTVGSATPTQDLRVCTLIGCESQVVFELDIDLASGTTYELRACIDDRCEQASVAIPPTDGAAVPAGSEGPFVLDPQNDVVAFLIGEGDFPGTHAVSLTLDDGSRNTRGLEGDVEFERLQPNGEGCEPICWQATVTA